MNVENSLQKFMGNIIGSSKEIFCNKSCYSLLNQSFEEILKDQIVLMSDEFDLIIKSMVEYKLKNKYSLNANVYSNNYFQQGCTSCKDGTYKIKKGDSFWQLENKWGIPFGSLVKYNPGVNPANLQIDQVINVSPTNVSIVDSPMQRVHLNTGSIKPPKFTFDEDFPYDPKAKATVKDRANWVKWGAIAKGADALKDLDDGVEAYMHYRNGNGVNKTFSFKEYISEDSSGSGTINNINTILEDNLPTLLPYEGQRDFYIKPLAANGASKLFKYPDTENWQKAIGAYNFWVTGKVTAKQVGGKLHFTVTYTLNAIDRYNFNKGMKDITSKTPDDVNGRFSTLGWAHSYIHKSTFTGTLKFVK